jgi:hypothetical protein
MGSLFRALGDQCFLLTKSIVLCKLCCKRFLMIETRIGCEVPKRTVSASRRKRFMNTSMRHRHCLEVTAGATSPVRSGGASPFLLKPPAQGTSAVAPSASPSTDRVRTLMHAGWRFPLGDGAGAQALPLNASSWQQGISPCLVLSRQQDDLLLCNTDFITRRIKE